MIDEPFPDHWFDMPDGVKSLSAYFLSTVPMTAFLPWQRRLAFDASGEGQGGALVVCEHPPGITVGRDGSRVHIRLTNAQLHALGWDVRWVARGGGVLLHQPGQIAISFIHNFDCLKLNPTAYRDAIQEAVLAVLAKYVPEVRVDLHRAGLFVRDRMIAHTGIAIRSGITSFGITVNANPDLDFFRSVWVDGETLPMTSLERESTLRIRIPTLRQQLAEAIAAAFGYDRLSVFHHHPALGCHDPYATAR